MNKKTERELSEWEIREECFSPEISDKHETIFTLGNGYLGQRGTLEEETNTYCNGTYINGFYESRPIVYGESAYGYAENSQSMLNVINGKRIRLTIDNDQFDLNSGKIISSVRVLKMDEGVLYREVLWVSPSGKKVKLKTGRIVPLSEKGIAVTSFSVTMIDTEADIIISSEIDGNVRNMSTGRDPRIGSTLKGQTLIITDGWASGNRCLISGRTENSGLSLTCMMSNVLETEAPYTMESGYSDNVGTVLFRFNALPDTPAVLTKYLSYHTSARADDNQLADTAGKELTETERKGFSGLITEQKKYMHDFWERSDVMIEGNPLLQQSIRFNIFHLLQSTGKDGHTSIAAKGLTGEGYEGQYFWDTEIYVLPFFIYTSPEIARSLLKFRCGIIDNARKSNPKQATAKTTKIDSPLSGHDEFAKKVFIVFSNILLNM